MLFYLFFYLFINCVILTLKNVEYQFNTKYSNNTITFKLILMYVKNSTKILISTSFNTTIKWFLLYYL